MALGGGEDFLLEVGAPARIDAGGEVVLVDQRLELGEAAMDLGARHRRHEMVDDHRRRAALGLAALARVVDDEGIDERERPERDLRPARLAQPEGLAGQPFEIAVLAELDHRVGGERLAEPGVEGEVMVRRHQRRVVVGRLRIDGVAAAGLDADHDVAEAVDGEMEGAVGEERVVLGRAPALGQRGAVGGWDGGEEGFVGGQGQTHGLSFRASVSETRNPEGVILFPRGSGSPLRFGRNDSVEVGLAGEDLCHQLGAGLWEAGRS